MFQSYYCTKPSKFLSLPGYFGKPGRYVHCKSCSVALPLFFFFNFKFASFGSQSVERLFPFVTSLIQYNYCASPQAQLFFFFSSPVLPRTHRCETPNGACQPTFLTCFSAPSERETLLKLKTIKAARAAFAERYMQPSRTGTGVRRVGDCSPMLS